MSLPILLVTISIDDGGDDSGDIIIQVVMITCSSIRLEIDWNKKCVK